MNVIQINEQMNSYTHYPAQYWTTPPNHTHPILPHPVRYWTTSPNHTHPTLPHPVPSPVLGPLPQTTPSLYCSSKLTVQSVLASGIRGDLGYCSKSCKNRIVTDAAHLHTNCKILYACKAQYNSLSQDGQFVPSISAFVQPNMTTIRYCLDNVASLF